MMTPRVEQRPLGIESVFWLLPGAIIPLRGLSFQKIDSLSRVSTLGAVIPALEHWFCSGGPSFQCLWDRKHLTQNPFCFLIATLNAVIYFNGPHASQLAFSLSLYPLGVPASPIVPRGHPCNSFYYIPCSSSTGRRGRWQAWMGRERNVFSFPWIHGLQQQPLDGEKLATFLSWHFLAGFLLPWGCSSSGKGLCEKRRACLSLHLPAGLFSCWRAVVEVQKEMKPASCWQEGMGFYFPYWVAQWKVLFHPPPGHLNMLGGGCSGQGQ